MIQIIPRVNVHGLFGRTLTPYVLNAGLTWTDFGLDSARHPVSVAGTFRHLIAGCAVPHATMTVTLVVNGVPTALTATVDAAASLGSNTTTTVTVAAGDDVCYQLEGPLLANPGLLHHSTCIEFEGAACSYGLAPTNGNVAAGAAHYGGAFGNGVLQTFGGGGLSNSTSICAVAGTVTRLDLRTYAGAPGASSWVGHLRVNSVTQDGTAGTVNTTCTLTGAATQAFATFALPVAISDRVDVIIARTGADAPFALAQVGASIAFVPDTPDLFMLCGGSNDAIRDTGPDWKWTRTDQLVATEPQGSAPVGPAGFQARGLYVVRIGSPGAGRGTVYTLRRSGVDTALTLTIQDLALSGQVLGAVDVTVGDTVTLQAAPFNTPGSNNFYWGLAVASASASAPGGTARRIRRLRRAPHLSAEQVAQFFARFQLDLEAGVGNAADPGADPQVWLRWSDDGGHTWRAPLAVSAGTIGAFRRRAIWRRLGRSRDRVFEVSMNDPVKWALLAASLDAGKGTS